MLTKLPYWTHLRKCGNRRPHLLWALQHHCFEEQIMGKYFLGWILGVPAIVLVAIYIFMH